MNSRLEDLFFTDGRYVHKHLPVPVLVKCSRLALGINCFISRIRTAVFPVAVNFIQCCGSGSVGSLFFWASWIRIRIQ
jgi:hypothetical protein